MNSIATYTPFNAYNQILEFPLDLKFRVYYLEAPLSFLGERIGIQYVNNLLSINGFHTGIGFQCTDKSRPYEFTFDEIVAQGFVISALLPQIIGTGPDATLKWNNQPQITLGSFIDKFYWERSTYMCTITSSQLITVQNWILKTWIPNNPIYSLLSAIKSTSENDVFNPIFRSSICDTFCYSMLFFIQGVDGGDQTDPTYIFITTEQPNICIEYVTPSNLSIAAFVSSEPNSIIPVDFESNKLAIISFYIEFEAAINEAVNLETTIQQLISELQAAHLAERYALIRQITNELFTLLHVIDNIYEGFPVAYYYGYGTGSNIGKVQYWQINNPELFLTYINSNLKRSYPSIDYLDKNILDNFSLDLDCDCRIIIDETSWFWWIIIGIIIIIFILLIIIII